MQKQRKLLHINSASENLAPYAAIAATCGLDLLHCPDDRSWPQLRDIAKSLVVLVIGPDTSPEEAFRAIEHFRLSPFHAGLPIALIQPERDLTLATQAMSAGVTEIFLQPENKPLSDFIAECAAAGEAPSFSGKALVVEDDEMFAEYLSDLCRTLGFATTLVDSFEKAVEALQQHRFQIVITDVVLKGTKTGLTLLRHIHQEHGTNFPVIVTSGYDDLPRRLMALKNGVGDFISKPFAGEEFIWRVQRVMQLVALNEPGNSQQFTESSLGVRNDLTQILSPREYEIFNSMLKGLGDKEIAASLGISYWTVRTHVQQIFAKTGAINRRELMARYITSTGNNSQ